MNIPIIMLHYFENDNLKGVGDWSISNQNFSILLDCIEEKGLQTITFEEIVTSKANVNIKNAVILTFDDCPANLFDFAVPELIRRKMKAVFYVPTGYINGYNEWDVSAGFDKIQLINEEQIKFLSSNQMEIGSHGHLHLNQSKISLSLQQDELKNPKQVLEKLTKKPIYSFAFPYGEPSKSYKKLLKSFAYSYGVTIYKGYSNRLALRRIGIHKSDTKKSILFKLSTKYSVIRHFLDPYLAFKKMLKR